MRPQTILAALAGLLAGAVLVLPIPVPGRQERTADVALERVRADTLLAWAHGELPDGYASAARDVPGVEAVAEVRSGTVFLDGWTSRDGAAQAHPSGMPVPLEVAAIDPDGYARFVPPADRGALDGLRAGAAILGTGAASRRDAASLRFGEVTLPVAATLRDELVGAHEVVVDGERGAALGVVRRRYVLVAVDADADAERVSSRLATLAPGVAIRVRAPGETPVFRHGDAVLAPSAIKEIFGEFAARPDGVDLRIDPAWTDANLSTEQIGALGLQRCHRGIIPQLRGAMDELAARGLAGGVDPLHGGCFSPRFLNRDPGAGISHHAWGIAIDFNVASNPYGVAPQMDPRIVEVLERWGFAWGGRWLVPDGMHFEYVRLPLPQKG